MTDTDQAALLAAMTDGERKEFDQLLAQGKAWSPLPGPQLEAYLSEADVLGYGGAAGGGKSDLIDGLCLKHKRCLVMRREKTQTEGLIQRMEEITGDRDGYNSQKSIWRIGGSLIEYGGLDNMGDERKWQGRAHDLKAFDEATEMREGQVRFCMGWLRTSDPKLKCRVLMTFNPPTTTEGRWVIDFFGPWLDKKHPNPALPGELRWFTTIAGRDHEVVDRRPFVLVDGEPRYSFDPDKYDAEEIIVPKSRTFIPARVTDNPFYMDSGYMAQLQAMPEPLRSQMLFGDFSAGVQDDPFQVIPTEWVEAAMARWKPMDVLPEMDSQGIDVARGGIDNTIIYNRHGNWYDKAKVYPGADTPDGPKVAALTIAANRDQAPMHIDVVGVGSSPFDFLNQANQHVLGINVGTKSLGHSEGTNVGFGNLKTELWWGMREDLDPTNNRGISLPPDPQLLADLTAPLWSVTGQTITMETRKAIIKRIGRSPDWGSAIVLASIETTKRRVMRALAKKSRKSFDPFA